MNRPELVEQANRIIIQMDKELMNLFKLVAELDSEIDDLKEENSMLDIVSGFQKELIDKFIPRKTND